MPTEYKVFIMFKSGGSTTRTISTKDFSDFRAFARAVEIAKITSIEPQAHNEVGIIKTDTLYLDSTDISVMYPVTSKGNFPTEQ